MFVSNFSSDSSCLLQTDLDADREARRKRRFSFFNQRESAFICVPISFPIESSGHSLLSIFWVLFSRHQEIADGKIEFFVNVPRFVGVYGEHERFIADAVTFC